jgi:hypothetical protein
MVCHFASRDGVFAVAVAGWRAAGRERAVANAQGEAIACNLLIGSGLCDSGSASRS